LVAINAAIIILSSKNGLLGSVTEFRSAGLSQCISAVPSPVAASTSANQLAQEAHLPATHPHKSASVDGKVPLLAPLWIVLLVLNLGLPQE
jgi:hypothetical protein